MPRDLGNAAKICYAVLSPPGPLGLFGELRGHEKSPRPPPWRREDGGFYSSSGVVSLGCCGLDFQTRRFVGDDAMTFVKRHGHAHAKLPTSAQIAEATRSCSAGGASAAG